MPQPVPVCLPTSPRRAHLPAAALPPRTLVPAQQHRARPVRHPAREQPLVAGHAHTDCQHPRPLHDALEHGFSSVEADVHLVGDRLLVAHDLEDVHPARTLQALYLDPLARRVRRARGRLGTRPAPPVQLLVDVKSEAEETYLRLSEVLAGYRGVVTRFVATSTGWRTEREGVDVVVSGNRAPDLMARQLTRYAAYDGRIAESPAPSPPDPALVPLVSEEWGRVFSWRGEGDLPYADRAHLHALVTIAHAEGRSVRFWGTPDTPGAAREAVWAELRAAGVDLVSTDDLAGFRTWLLTHPGTQLPAPYPRHPWHRTVSTAATTPRGRRRHQPERAH